MGVVDRRKKTAGKRFKNTKLPGEVQALVSLATDVNVPDTHRLPHIAELTQHILSQWGGLEKFARQFKDEFDQSSPGSVHRARLLDTQVRLLEYLSKMGYAGNRNHGEKTMEDLVSAAQRIMGEMKADQSETPAETPDLPEPFDPGPRCISFK